MTFKGFLVNGYKKDAVLLWPRRDRLDYLNNPKDVEQQQDSKCKKNKGKQ